ncbi:MAG: SprT family zinc-dependent metalloprotease [Verrucomicrobiota bacterium]
MRARDEARAAVCRAKLEGLQLPHLAAEITVEWNARLRSTAGRAWLRDKRIELNPGLRTLGEEEVERTLLHELAHLVATARAGRRRIAPHGPEWRQACADLGIAGEARTHRLDLPRRRQARRHRYRCLGCQAVVARARRFAQEVACRACCQRYAGGRFDRRFLLHPIEESDV